MARHRAPGRHAKHGHQRHTSYGNPADLAAFIRRQEAPSRAAWQKPAGVLRALGLQRGAVVADVGAGPGYWSLKLARAVGPAGHVYAVEPELPVLDVLRRRITAARVQNVTPVLGASDDPRLPPSRCQLALMVNTYHHLSDGPAFLRRLARALAPNGHLAAIDFVRRETPVGPPLRHRVARERFLRDARRAGLTLAGEHGFLPYQYFVVLRPRRRGR